MRVLRPAVLAAAACVLLAAAALAQTGGLSVTGLPPLSARPQEFVTLVYSVRHDGAQTVEVAFSLSAPPGFVPLEAPGTRTLAPGAEALVFVTLLVPQNAAAGDHPVTLTARRVDDPTRQASATTVVRVLAAAALRVRAAGLARFEAGEAVVPFEVVNDGNVRDRVDLTAASSDGFALRVAPEQVEVDPGVRAAVEVRLAVPAPAAARLRQTVVTLTAVSTGPGQARASASATVTLEPPGPDEVSTQLAWVMPSQLSLSFAQQRDPAAFSGLAQFRGGGAFAEGHALRAALAVDLDLSVRALALGLETPWAVAELGDVRAASGAFVSLSGRGARLTLRSPLATTLTLASVVDQPERPLLGAFELRLAGLRFGLGGVMRWAGLLRGARFGALLAAQPLPALALEGQAAFSVLDGTAAHALSAQARLRQAPLDLGAGYRQSSAGFPGQSAGRQLTFSQSLGLERLVLQANVALSLDAFDSLLPATAQHRIQLVSRVFPGEGLPSLTATFEFDVQRSALPPEVTDIQALSANISLFQPFPFASLGVSFALSRTLDLVAPSDLGSLKLGALVGWNAGALSPSLRVSQAAELDFSAGRVTAVAFEAEGALGVRLGGAGQLTLRARHAPPANALSAALTLSAEAGALQLSGRVAFEAGAPADFSVQMTASRDFGLRLPFLPVAGQVQGRVFVDDDGDGQADPGEGVGGVVLAGGGARARSDARGVFRFVPLPPGALRVQPEQLPAGLAAAVPLPLEVTLAAGQRLTLSLPLKRVAAVEGVVFDDADGDGQRGETEAGAADVPLRLTGPGGLTRQTRSLANGRFAFSGLDAGTYTLALGELPGGLVATTEAALTLSLAVGEVRAVAFGVRQRPREVRLTFAEPIASFTVDPPTPQVGQTVVFDAGASFDPDGRIVDFAWDLDGDGEVDARGQVVETAYAAPGEVTVTLWVTDDVGATGQAQRRVQVVAP